MNIVKGAKVQVFDDPIDCTRLEGIGTVTKVLRVEDWCDTVGNQIVHCNVRFTRSDNPKYYSTGGVFERDVSRLAV